MQLISIFMIIYYRNCDNKICMSDLLKLACDMKELFQPIYILRERIRKVFFGRVCKCIEKRKTHIQDIKIYQMKHNGKIPPPTFTEFIFCCFVGVNPNQYDYEPDSGMDDESPINSMVTKVCLKFLNRRIPKTTKQSVQVSQKSKSRIDNIKKSMTYRHYQPHNYSQPLSESTSEEETTGYSSVHNLPGFVPTLNNSVQPSLFSSTIDEERSFYQSNSNSKSQMINTLTTSKLKIPVNHLPGCVNNDSQIES